MSELENMILTLCPSGVAFKPLGEVGTFIRGNGLQKKDFSPEGVGCIHYGQIYTHYGLYTYDTKSKVPATLATRLAKVDTGDLVIACTSENIEDVCKAVVWLGHETIVTGGHSAVFKHSLEPKFVAYFFQSNAFQVQKRKYARGTKVIDIRIDDLAKIEIPVPPIEIQRIIVSYLDNFTELTDQLSAELMARRAQYEYYRDNLLSFSDLSYGGGYREGLKWVELNRVAEIYDGTHQTPHYTDFGVRFVSVENIDSLYESPKYISFTDFEKYKVRPQKDDVLMTRIGSIGLCAVVERNEPLAYYVSLALIRPNTSVILSKYLLHVIHSRIGQRELAKRTLTTAAPIKINMGDIGKIVIPIPPIAIQERIISILDSFDLICNSKTCGLPAAINARRLQYIYYREKLLTFKRKTVA